MVIGLQSHGPNFGLLSLELVRLALQLSERDSTEVSIHFGRSTWRFSPTSQSTPLRIIGVHNWKEKGDFFCFQNEIIISLYIVKFQKKLPIYSLFVLLFGKLTCCGFEAEEGNSIVSYPGSSWERCSD